MFQLSLISSIIRVRVHLDFRDCLEITFAHKYAEIIIKLNKTVMMGILQMEMDARLPALLRLDTNASTLPSLRIKLTFAGESSK